MAKLFNDRQVATPGQLMAQGDLGLENLTEVLVEYSESLDMVQEATQMALERLQTVEGMQTHLSAQKLCSVAYLNTVESYSPLVRSMGARMGVKHFPSLEDFGNKNAAKDAHNFAVEGFKEMMSKMWERIKGFFRELFKKVKLFFRRLTGANLELDNYEKYCDQLIGKLKTNNATISDKSPVVSEVPKLLCDSNGAPVDSDFVLNQGTVKMKNLVSQINKLSFGQESANLHKSVAEFRQALEGYITEVSGAVSQDDFVARTDALAGQGDNLMTMVFPYVVPHASIPSKVYDQMRERFEGRITNDYVSVRSMVDDLTIGGQMPKSVNMYLASIVPTATTPVGSYVFIGGEHNVTVNANLPPISSLNNLVKFHSDYKAILGKVNDNSGNKSIDALSNEIDKLLSLLQKRFPTLVTATTPVAYNGSGLEYLEQLMQQVRKDPHLVRRVSVLIAEIAQEYTDSEKATIYAEYGEAYDANETNRITNAVKELKAIENDPNTVAFITKAISGVKEKLGAMPSAISPEDMLVRSEKVKALEKSLTHIFSQLQILYRGMMVEFYKVYTELRYATIKYIYDSAKRYTY